MMTVLRRRCATRCFRCVAGGTAFALVAGARAQQPTSVSSRLRFVVEARQLGPVGYRDPLGVMSPDGQWLAYSSKGHLQLTHLAGGPVTTLGPRANVLAIAWLADSRQLAALETDGATPPRWSVVAIPAGTRGPLWSRTFPKAASGTDSVAVDPNRFRNVAWSRDGARLAAIIPQERGFLLWTGKADGSDGRIQRSNTPLNFLAWSPNGTVVACLAASEGKQYLSVPCGSRVGANGTEAYGPIAFSADGTKLYFGSPNTRGTLDLGVWPVGGGAATRLTSFARDTYQPSVATDGRVLFGIQDYRTFVAVIPAGGGAIKQLTSFQSETPSWSRDDRLIGITYGTWRRFINDLRYPDIAQDLAVIRSDVDTPSGAPFKVVRASPSEDQGLDWSPNGHWIVLHSHANGLDDVWIQPADGSSPARSITTGGAETGWPRWSPNGSWIAYSTEVPAGGRMRGALFAVGVDSATGRVTREARRVAIDGLQGDVDQVEWSPTSDSLVFLAADGLESRAIYVVGREGGQARLVHRFSSDQQFSGVGVSPDFRWVAFIAPATDGYLQLFRMPLSGGTPTQLTFDPIDKTQPAVSHDGTRIAFTVFSYTMQFWLMER